MTRLSCRTLSTLLAILIAGSNTGAFAVNIAATVIRRGPARGAIAPLSQWRNQPLSGSTLRGVEAIPGAMRQTNLAVTPRVKDQPAMNAAPKSSWLQAAPQALPASAVSPVTAEPIPADAGQAATTEKVADISQEVRNLLEAAGPVAQTGAENAKGMGAEIFQILLAEPRDNETGTTPAPAETDDKAAYALNLTQKTMLKTLVDVAAVFASRWAPVEWKKEKFLVDVKKAYDEAAAVIRANPGITTPQFQDLLVKFVQSMRDYHVSIAFNATERARLPFMVIGAEDKYFLAYVDRDRLPQNIFPFGVGDEVVAFDGQPVAEAVKAVAGRLGNNVAETDRRWAEIMLTNRRRTRGDHVPKGNVVIVIRGQDGQLTQVTMPWDHIPELVPQNVPVRDVGLLQPPPSEAQPQSGIDDSPAISQASGKTLTSLLDRIYAKAVHPLASILKDMRVADSANPFMIGARKSFVPQLGDIVWQSKDDAHFHAYIFKNPDGRKIGFVRIAAYDGAYAEVQEFGQLMAKLQKKTDALVIDQVSNPGGDVFYLYALASHLTDKPLVTPKHQLLISQEDGQWAAELLLQLMGHAQASRNGKDDDEAVASDEPPNSSGYPVTRKFMQLLVKFAKFIIDQLTLGNRLTPKDDATHLWGVDKIDPAPDPEQRYTKPVLLLTNALDFSGGDFFPAIMQDNKRVTILGARTAGAGGMVKPFAVDNQFGISDLNATWSIAWRPTGNPIENLGVTPDIPYDLTAKDMRTGFSEYRSAILKALQDLLPSQAPADDAQDPPAPTPEEAGARTKRPALNSSTK